ncbi:30S ribosomal protein S28e [Candidatus Woesearchaeota archaeon]|nr:30S ribosomal protein S28e [Candidatus Woesearchaeota archaeon]
MAHEDPAKHLKESPRGQVKRKPQGQQEEQVKGSVNFSFATPAKVEEIIGRTGSRGEAIQIRCRVMDGRDKNKILRRNVKGPIQIGDVLMLRETEFEAGQLTKAGRGSG